MADTPDRKDIKAVYEDKPSLKLTNIRSLFNTQKLLGKVMVLVEGDADVSMYGFLLGTARFYFYNCGGCKDFIFLIGKLNVDHSTDCIVIRDADFDRLNADCHEYDKFKNFFLTDTHDLETMMLCEDGKVNKDIERKIICENIGTDSIPDIVLKCMDDLKPLSYLKWYNSSNDLGLEFRHIGCGDLYDGDRNTIDEWVNKLWKADGDAKKRFPTLLDDVSHFMQAQPNVDVWQITNGHDLCDAMMSLIRKQQKEQKKLMNQEGQAYGRGNGTAKILFGLISGAYTLEQFEKTKLYGSITQWCCDNDIRMDDRGGNTA